MPSGQIRKTKTRYPERDTVSLLRRLKFGGDSRLFFDGLPTARLAAGRLSPFWAEALHLLPDRLATTAFDLIESVRAGRWLACIGQARQAIDAIEAPLPQKDWGQKIGVRSLLWHP